MIPVCPKCDVALLILKFKSVEVDYCERCRGIWLDAGELEALMQQTGESATDSFAQFRSRVVTATPNRRHLCPRGDERLEELTVEDPAGGSLTLDRCPVGHGLWFDADELQQLLRMYPLNAGVRKAIDCLNEIFGSTPKT